MDTAPEENGKKALTMAEYIKKEAAIRALLNDAPEQVGYSREDAADCIRYMDAADVAPMRHGRWIEPSRLYYGAKQYECSLCYSDTFWKKHSITEKYPHCPNCGATMDLED